MVNFIASLTFIKYQPNLFVCNYYLFLGVLGGLLGVGYMMRNAKNRLVHSISWCEVESYNSRLKEVLTW